MQFFYLDNTRRGVYFDHQFLLKGQRPFGLSDAAPFLSKAGSAAVTWTVAAIRLYYGCSKLLSVTGTAASTHGLFICLLLAFVLVLSMVLNMDYTAPAEKKDSEYLIGTVRRGESGGEESRRLFEEEGLVGTQTVMLLGAEDEGAEAVPPFFKEVVEPQRMTPLEVWTHFRMMTKG